MSTGRTQLFHYALITGVITISCYACNKPNRTTSNPKDTSSQTANAPSNNELTAEAAQELLPAAASMSSADFETLAGINTTPSSDSIHSKTLTLILLTLNPQKASVNNKAVLEDFSFPTGDALPKPGAIAEVIYKSKSKGYVTFLQPNLITDCTCESDGDKASGFVTFSAPSLYTGKVQFIARRNEAKWQIEEFRLPNYGIKTVLGKDGTWQQSPMAANKTAGNEPAPQDSTETAVENKPPTELEPAQKSPPLTNAVARSLICKATSMTNANFQKFMRPASDVAPASYQNQSLTLTLLTHNIKKTLAKNPEATNDFQFLGDINLDKLSQALSRSESQGFASLIQPEFITHSACTTEGDRAIGFITFHAPELYSGKVDFIAIRQKDRWQIKELRLPHYEIKLVVNNDGNWQQAELAIEKEATP